MNLCFCKILWEHMWNQYSLKSQEELCSAKSSSWAFSEEHTLPNLAAMRSTWQQSHERRQRVQVQCEMVRLAGKQEGSLLTPMSSSTQREPKASNLLERELSGSSSSVSKGPRSEPVFLRGRLNSSFLDKSGASMN